MAFAVFLGMLFLLSWRIPQPGEVIDESTEIRMQERAVFMKAMEKKVEEMFRKYENPEPDIFSWLLELAPPIVFFKTTLLFLWIILDYVLFKKDLALKLAQYMDILQLVDLSRALHIPVNWYMFILHVHCIVLEYVLCRLDLATQLRNHIIIMDTFSQVKYYLDEYWDSIRMFLLNIVPSILMVAGPEILSWW